MEEGVVVPLTDSTSVGALAVLKAMSRPQAVGAQRGRLNMGLPLCHCHVHELTTLENIVHR